MGRTGCSRAQQLRLMAPARVAQTTQPDPQLIQLKAKTRDQTEAAGLEETHDRAELQDLRNLINAETPGSRTKSGAYA